MADDEKELESSLAEELITDIINSFQNKAKECAVFADVKSLDLPKSFFSNKKKQPTYDTRKRIDFNLPNSILFSM